MKNSILILLLIIITSCTNYGEKLTFKGTEVYYKDNVTKEQATKLGKYLIAEGFTTGDAKSVQFIRNQNNKTLTFRMVASKETAVSDKSDFIFTSFSRSLSEKFGEPVDFELTDNAFKTLKTFYNKDIPKLINAKKTQILYTNKVTKEETQKLANYLISSEFADDKNPKTIKFDKDNDTYLFKMVVYKGAEKNESNVTLLGLFAKELSEKVFDNKSVKLHMCDDEMNTIKIVN